MPSFELDVQAAGSFKPGHPIHLTLAARANYDVPDAELRLTLPEVSSAEKSSWGIVVIPVDEEIEPHAQVRRAFAAGDRVIERVTLTIPEPGYYHVAATGYRHPSEAQPGALPDVSRRDYWLWIAEHGGALTATFDTTRFAPDDRKQSGPRGSQRRPSRVRSGDANITCTLLPAGGGVILQSGCPDDPDMPIGGSQPPPSATASFRVLYTRSDRGISNRPVPGARYTWNVVATSTGATVNTGSGFVGADGGVGTIDCKGPTDDRRISFTVYTLNDKANIKWGSFGELAYSQVMACGGHTDVMAQPEMAHLFLNTVKIYDGHQTPFSGFIIGRIMVALYDDFKTYYDHRHPDRELHIARDPLMIYGEYGVMVVTHEYGHAFQDTKLFTSPETNGLMRFQNNCLSVHPPETVQNMGCAFGEAFADWYAVVVRPNDLPSWTRDLESNYFYRNCQDGAIRDGYTVQCSTDGSRIQGAIGALLWDVSDSNNEYPTDEIQRAPWVVAERMRTCKVRVEGNWIAYTGIDHLIFCMEGRSPYRVKVRSASTGSEVVLTLFPARAQSQWATEASSGAPFPSSDAFRRLWLANLYSKLEHVGTSPSLMYLEAEPAPDPEPEPEPEPVPCYDCGVMY